MNNQTTNSFLKRSVKKETLDAISAEYTKTVGDAKQTGIQLIKDVVIGAGLGGAFGKVVGRPSLLIGALATGYGHYSGSRFLSTLGIGIMTTAGWQEPTQPVNGLGAFENAKEKLLELKDGFFTSLYLDKIIKPKDEKKKEEKKDDTPVGEVQYFVYPQKEASEEIGEVDLSELSKIENDIVQEGLKFESNQQGKETVKANGNSDLEGTIGEMMDIPSTY